MTPRVFADDASASTPRGATPWYRQFWPWFLIVLPASSVVFSFATLYVAIRHADEVMPHEGDSSSCSAPREPAAPVRQKRPPSP